MPRARSILGRRRELRKVVREFHDRGTKWLMESPQNVRDLLSYAASDIYESLDFSRIEKLPASMIPASLRKQEADLVFRIPYRIKDQEREILIFLLLEHQSKPDPLMAFRLLFYMVLLWDSQRQRWEREKTPAAERLFWPIIPVVFYTGTEKWEAPLTLASMMDLPEVMAGFVPRFDSLLLKLHDKSRQELLKDDRPFGWLMSVIQKEHASRAEFEAALMDAVDHFSGVVREDRAAWETAMMYLFLLVKHRRGAKEAADLSEKMEERIAPLGLRKEVEKMEQTLAEVQYEQGYNRGIEQAEVRVTQKVLLRLIRQKFGSVSARLAKRVRALDDQTKLNACMDRLLSATRLEDLGLGID